MKTYNLAVVGVGAVGKALIDVLDDVIFRSKS